MPPKPDYVMFTAEDGARAVVRVAGVDMLRDANAQERQGGTITVMIVGGVQVGTAQKLDAVIEGLGIEL
jgi:signal transduction protein with GAF and PtsI domain